MTQESGLARIQLAQANLIKLEQQPMGLTSTLLGRKGLVRLLALPDVSAETAESIAASYYSSPRFDVGRSMAQVLATAYDADATLNATLGGAVVILGMDVYIVATPGVVAWIVGYESMQRAFDVARRVGVPARLEQRPSYAVDWELRVAHWRLTAGDMVIAIVSDTLDPLADERVARLAGRRGSAQSLANAAAKSATRADGRATGALVCVAGGFAPVPASPNDTPQVPHSRPIDDNWTRRRGVSPIWIALVLAALAILVTVRLVGPNESLSAMQEYLQLTFGPDPTPTATLVPTVTPAQTVAPLLSAPQLVAPTEGARLAQQVRLSWTWRNRLVAGQIYEVRIARAGENLTTLDKTVEQQTSFTPSQTSWYEWAVVVVSDQDSGPARQLSELSATGSFFWSGE